MLQLNLSACSAHRWHLGFSFTLPSPFSSGCCCRRAGTCDSGEQACRASASQPHTPAPLWAPTFSHAPRRPRRQCSELPWDCGDAATSCQILPSGQLLSQLSQTQYWFKKTWVMIGWNHNDLIAEWQQCMEIIRERWSMYLIIYVICPIVLLWIF